jgi:hypothetical protein
MSHREPRNFTIVRTTSSRWMKSSGFSSNRTGDKSPRPTRRSAKT